MSRAAVSIGTQKATGGRITASDPTVAGIGGGAAGTIGATAVPTSARPAWFAVVAAPGATSKVGAGELETDFFEL